jgi:hypothetical protein
MKTLKLSMVAFGILCLIAGNDAMAQTKQFNLYAKVEHGLIMCLADNGITVSGDFTMHFTYHLDKKTGKVVQIHYNILHSCLTNDVTGEEYFIIDTSTDNSNLWGGWDFFSVLKSINIPYGIYYEVEDGFIDFAPNPGEGKYIESYKVINKSGGKVASMFFMIQLHMNADGDITGGIEKVVIDCN